MGNNLIKKNSKNSKYSKKKKLKRHISNSIDVNRYNNDITNYRKKKNLNNVKVYNEDGSCLNIKEKENKDPKIQYIVYPTQIINYPMLQCPTQSYPIQSYPMQPYPMQPYLMQPCHMQQYPTQQYPTQPYPIGKIENNIRINRKNQVQTNTEEYDIPVSISRPAPSAPPLYNDDNCSLCGLEGHNSGICYS